MREIPQPAISLMLAKSFMYCACVQAVTAPVVSSWLSVKGKKKGKESYNGILIFFGVSEYPN